jgi:uncharacterized membrane-anchored protein YjiN (DUF445 family)
VLVQGCEAALVGGLCDWFAVVRTYQAIEARRDEVADAIGDWVSGELLSQRVIQGRLDALLDDPEVHDRVCQAIDRKLGSSAETRELLAGMWKSIETNAVDLAVGYDLRETDLDASKALLKDEVIVRTVSRCLGEAVLEIAEGAELSTFLDYVLGELSWFKRLVVSKSTIQNALKDVGELLLTGAPAKADSGMLMQFALQMIQSGTNSYVAAWNKLRETDRRAAVGALLRHLSEPLLDAATQRIVSERERFRGVDRLRRYPPIANSLRRVQEFLSGDLSRHVGSEVSKSLKELPAKEFRSNLEKRTRSHLEMIRINGTVLGFVIGLLIGVFQTVVAAR